MKHKTTPQKLFLTIIDKASLKKNRSASDYYGKYLDKIIDITGGKVIYAYEEFNKS